ncbi:MAG: hypothetical protein NTX66_03885 [Candidatus Falkowbacteria bacterium]|nr:hypothetical protein [Candidatus Falkowbacteria bacterium]
MRKSLTSFLILSFLTSGLWGAPFINPAAAAVTPNDPYYYNQWYLPKIRADVAWERINSSPNITIAIIDSGVRI